jgi:hypothetical protein
MKLEESYSNISQLKEENQESHGAIEVIVEKPAVSKILNIESANFLFSPPGRPATTLEELIDGVSTKEETPDFVPNQPSNQYHILTTKQKTIPVSCGTKKVYSSEAKFIRRNSCHYLGSSSIGSGVFRQSTKYSYGVYPAS